MIVCSCNQLTDRQVLESLTGDSATRPRSPGQVYLCLGCKPNCGRCVQQIRQMFSDITSNAGSACQIGCAVCPGEVGHASPVSPAPVMTPAWQLQGGATAPRRRLVVPEAQRFSPPCGGSSDGACAGHQHHAQGSFEAQVSFEAQPPQAKPAIHHAMASSGFPVNDDGERSLAAAE